MQRVDKDKFLFLYTNNVGALSESQRDGLCSVLDLLMADDAVIDIRHAAYMLATVRHECAGKWKPIAEYGKGAGKKYGNPAGPYGNVYYGRGLTQNTWLENYQMLTAAWNKVHPDRQVDFVKNPDLLLVMEYSYFAMSYGMRKGAYTGVKLLTYIHDDVCDYLHARKIINGMDCAEKIADYAKLFEQIIRDTLIEEEQK